MLVLEGLVGLHRTIQPQLLYHYWLRHHLDYRDIEWFALEQTEIIGLFLRLHKVLHLDTFVDSDGYLISCKGFFPTVVDMMDRYESVFIFTAIYFISLNQFHQN